MSGLFILIYITCERKKSYETFSFFDTTISRVFDFKLCHVYSKSSTLYRWKRERLRGQSIGRPRRARHRHANETFRRTMHLTSDCPHHYHHDYYHHRRCGCICLYAKARGGGGRGRIAYGEPLTRAPRVNEYFFHSTAPWPTFQMEARR